MDERIHFGLGRYNPLVAIVAVLLSLFLLAAAIKEFKSIAYVGHEVPATNTITVTGNGEAFGIPDIATFSFSVQNEAKVIADAQKASSEEVNDILAFLKKSGIEEKDIKTAGYDIYPRYEYTNPSVSSYYPPPTGRQVLAAYVVTQTVTVKIRKTSDAGNILAGVGELGATNISGLSFTFDDDDALQNQARGKAIADAKSKADVLAKQLGVKLLRVTGYTENGNYPMYYAKAEMAGRGDAVMNVAPSVPVGENTITSTVSISYEVR